MIAHLLKLFWQRKASNTLLIAEVFISFLVLMAVVTAAVYSYGNYSRPLGFEFNNVWSVTVDVKQKSDDYWSADMVESARQVELALRSFPEVEAVAGMNYPPYSFGNSITVIDRGGPTIEWSRGEVTDDLNKVLGVNVVQGRWFEQSDDASTFRPVVINRRLAAELFRGRDPIGQLLDGELGDGDWRVVGVVEGFRKDGELSGEGNYAFFRINLDDTTHRPPRTFLLRMRPGTSPSVQQDIASRLQNAVKHWSFEVETLSDMRQSNFKKRIALLLAGGFIAANLILMVALGLIGVLWQNVTRRQAEIGLRRALGASAHDIYRQVLAELIIIASAGTLLGTLVVIQFPLLGVFQSVGWQVYMVAILISLLLMYMIMLCAALYPSRLATQIQPIEALHAD
ncbi:MAG: ABC transporter permease [Candidatus Zixiibacteriota bacterium]